MSANPDTVISSESPQNRVRDDGLLVSKTETLTDEPNTVTDISIQDSIDKTRVSGDQIEVVVMEKGLGENGLKVAPETDLLESKVETLTMEGPSCDGNGEIDVRDSVGEVRVSGDELGLVKEDVEKASDVNVISGEEMEGDKVAVGDDFSAVPDAVNEVRVSGDESGLVNENVEKVSDVNVISGEEKEGDKVAIGADFSAVRDVVNEVRVSGDELRLVNEDVEKASDVNVISGEETEGDKVAVRDDFSAVPDEVNEVRVSGDESGLVNENVEKVSDVNVISGEEKEGDKVAIGADFSAVRDVVNEVRVSGDELRLVNEDVEKASDVNVISGEETEGDKVAVRDDFSAVPDEVNEVRVPGDELGLVNEDVEKVSEVNEIGGEEREGDKVAVGADLLAVQDAVNEVRVSGDESGLVKEDVEKVSDVNVISGEEKEGDKVAVGADLSAVRDAVNEVRISGDESGLVKEDVEKVSDVNVISGEEKEGDKVAVGADFSAVRDAVNEVRVSGDEVGIVMEGVEKVLDVNGGGKEGDKAVVGSDLLDSKTEPLTMDLSSEHDAEVGVSGDEPATVLENVLDEKVVNNEVKECGKAVAGDDLLDSKTETSTMELASDLDKGGDTDLLVSKTETLTVDFSSEHDAEVGVSGDEPATVLENVLDEKVVNNEVKECGKAVAGDDLLDSKTETSTMELASDLDKGGDTDLLVSKTEPLTVDLSSEHDAEVGVSGDEPATVLENVLDEKVVNNEVKECGKAVAGDDLLDSKTETSTMELASDLDKGGDTDLLDSKTEPLTMDLSSEHDAEVGVSGDEPATVLENVENVLDEKVVNNEVKECGKAVAGDDLLDSKTETSTMELASDLDKGGDTDLLVSKTETLTVDLSSEHDAGGGVSGDEPATILENVENVLDEKVVNNEVKEGGKAVIGDDLLDSKTETLMMEPASDLGKGGDTVVQDSVGDASVSADEREIAMEKAGNVLDGKAVNNEGNKGDKTVNGADLLDLKTETLMMEASTDHDGGGDISMQNSVGVSGDEREVVMENVEKVLHENVVEEEEKDGEYKVADMVWAKVRNYPWWPGQIFDPSASTDQAKKYSNKKAFFVAYFGDQSFAWNKPSNIKPFRKNFSKMAKQSNSKGFFHAVNCALDEASRRVDFGLTCSCLSKEVYDQIKTQVFVNAGIKSEANRIDGGDRFSTVAAFKPENIVQSVQDLAREHFDGYSRLEVMSVRTQLLAYYRWKGYKIADYYEHRLWEEDKVAENAKPAFVGEKVSSKEWKLNACDSVPSKEEKDYTNMIRKGSSRDKVAENAKEDSVSEKVSSKKRKLEACDSVPSKKEERITDIDPKGSMSVSNGNNKMKKIGANKAPVEDDSESPLVEEDKLVEDAKLASVGEIVYSKRRKSKASDLVTSKQEKNMTEMTQEGSPSLSNGKDKAKKIGAAKATVEDDSELPSVEEDKVVEDAKPDSVSEKVYSKKRKSKASDSVPNKKGKRLTNMTAKGGSSVSNGKSKRKEKSGKIITTEGNGVKEKSQNGIGDKNKMSFRIGDSIMRIAKQLSESPSIIKKESQESRHDMKKNSQKRERNDKSDEQTENSPTLQKVPKTDRKQKKKERKSVEAIQLEE